MKGLCSYRYFPSVSRPFRRVEEAAAGLALLMSLVAAIEVHAVPQTDEPAPMPQFGAFENPDHLEARQFLSEKKWAEAAIVLRTLHKRNPSSVSISMDLVRALVYSGRREEALSVLGQALTREKRPQEKEALIRRTRVIARLFLTSGTFQTHQEALNLLRAGKLKAAREKFEKALETEPDNTEILTRVGQCLLLERDEDSAAERLRYARRLNPFDPQLRLWLGRALHLRGEAHEGVAELKSAYEHLRGSPSVAAWYAEALLSLGMRAQAMQLLEEDANRFPSHVQTLVTLARFRIQQTTKDPQALWAARKDLQVALSRIKDAEELGQPLVEPGVELQPTREQLSQEIEKLLEQVETRLSAERST